MRLRYSKLNVIKEYKSKRTGSSKTVRSHGWRRPSVQGGIYSVFWKDLSAY